MPKLVIICPCYNQIVEFKYTKPVEGNLDINPIDKIISSGLFETGYLDNLKIVEFGIDNYNEEIDISAKSKNDDLNVKDFIFGRTTDFVGIYSKADYDKLNPKETDDHHAIAQYFLAVKPTYEEFIAHEIAHNVFDLEYINNFGNYDEKGGIPAVSDEYSNSMRGVISNIILESYPNLEINRFEFNRQQICEIFAMLYEREFCKRENINIEAHSKVLNNCRTFIDDPADELFNFNSKNNRNCIMEDFYSENHILSLIAAPLIENLYINFHDRINLFWK